ncbi:MAG: 1-acyl-sn-glycerol-3-phosphate acyltransferase [Treponema sp.]|nr:1-acyl-sn-glycerol-3-phosphate acyltransferase [Treponema sp.]
MKREIPIFFASDNNYAPFLAVAMRSLLENASNESIYRIYVLYIDLSKENIEKLKKSVVDSPVEYSIDFKSLREEMENSDGTFHLRDYYTRETYCRLFIPRIFPQYDKIIYIDSDTAVVDDISELYDTELGDCVLAAAREDVIDIVPAYGKYIEKNLGLDTKTFFSAGVLLINADKYRESDFESSFIQLLNSYTFLITQDEDYLNVLCGENHILLDQKWNKGAFDTPGFDDKSVKIIHFKLNFKPWHFPNTKWSDVFWKYSEKTDFFEECKSVLNNYSDDDREKAQKGFEILVEDIEDCIDDPYSYAKTKDKAIDRVKILRKIDEYEREGRFSEDVEDDPPTIPLLPNQVDYMNKKFSNRVLTKIANAAGRFFINKLIKNHKLIIKEVRGMENYVGLKHTGAILTCNHFNAFDNFALYKAIEKHVYKKELLKVIREGNYTNFPGFYGFLFRHCNTLPLSQNPSTMKKFIEAVRQYLFQGRHILVYAEQAMWWNYKKPRPLTNGAFKFAADNKVPVIPFFITMNDSNFIGQDGFPVQEYTIHILEPIYPDQSLSVRQNVEAMRSKNFEAWKKIYEETYGIALEYKAKKEKKVAEWSN